MIRILFGIIASLGLIMAMGTVLARNLVHAGLFLVAFFFLVACQFILLEAEFMAAMQVLVYIGAVAIILMFGIMLTRNVQGDETTSGRWFLKLPAAAVSLALFAILVAGIADEKATGGGAAWSSIKVRPAFRVATAAPGATNEKIDGRSLAIADMSRSVGSEMLQRFVIPFEVSGILLTAALIGAIALAQSDESEEPMSALNVKARGANSRSPSPASNGHSAGPLPASAKLSPAAGPGAAPSP